jgi:PPOX class probable F420-dependent enzyme
MKSEEVELLKGENYISFSTKKRSGEFVATPVWFAPHEGSYYLFSATESGKVKRLRNFSESSIAPCTMSGTVTGEWIDTGSVLLKTEEDKGIALQALRRKYGLQMKIGDIFARITGKMEKRAYIKVDIK